MPGVNNRFWPCASWLLIVWTESDGFATKKSETGIDRPGVAPEAQDSRTEFVVAAGTKTWYLPLPSTYRYGFSRFAGVVARVVYGPVQPSCGKHCAGAPTSPAKTWFHTPLLQPSSVLLRTRNCCCDPLTIVLPSNLESAMKPPLAKDGPVQ